MLDAKEVDISIRVPVSQNEWLPVSCALIMMPVRFRNKSNNSCMVVFILGLEERGTILKTSLRVHNAC